METYEQMEGADDAALAGLLRQSVGALSRSLRGARAETGVGLTGLSILGRLHLGGDATPSALAAQERTQPQSLTRVLAQLEEKALIERHPDPSDRRQVIVRITPAGRALLREDARAREAWLAEAITRLTPTERGVLRLAADLMRRLAEERP